MTTNDEDRPATIGELDASGPGTRTDTGTHGPSTLQLGTASIAVAALLSISSAPVLSSMLALGLIVAGAVLFTRTDATRPWH